MQTKKQLCSVKQGKKFTQQCVATVGQHPLVIQLLKRMLNIRPPKPRYTHTWDVHLVTKYLDCLGKIRILTLKLLSIKHALLLAFSYPERVSSLSKRDLRYCHVSPEGISFTLTTPRKPSSPEQLSQSFFTSFPDNKRLCPVVTLRHYLKATLMKFTSSISILEARPFIFFVC